MFISVIFNKIFYFVTKEQHDNFKCLKHYRKHLALHNYNK